MAMGWEEGVVAALCTALLLRMVRGGLGKTWLCPLAFLPWSGVAASVFQAGMGGGKVSGKPSWDSQGDEKILIPLLRQLGAGSGCSQ